jgi:hypothetical protein
MGGYGWIGSQRVEFRCRRSDRGYRLRVEHGELIEVSADGSEIEHLHSASEAASYQRSLIPAALILALALHDTWCLHASAVARNGRVVAFIGAAGSGKSTLASFLGRTQGEWQLAADDVLPFAFTAEDAMALPHFPQPGLAYRDQGRPPVPEQLPIQAIYLLDQSSEVRLSSLSRMDGLAAAVRHTLGAGLFGRRQLESHLSAATRLATGPWLRRLCYPRRHAVLPQVAAAVSDDLGAR